MNVTAPKQVIVDARVAGISINQPIKHRQPPKPILALAALD